MRAESVTLRDTTSRWGSCTAQGALNFSWRLIMAPPFVLDYLAAHEVAHLVHHDHSARFWTLTRRLAPETDRAEAWLRAQGASLHRYGADAGSACEVFAQETAQEQDVGQEAEQNVEAGVTPAAAAPAQPPLDPIELLLDPIEALLARARALVEALEPRPSDAGRRVA